MVGKQQEMMLRTTGGKEAAKVFDSKRVDDITRAILWVMQPKVAAVASCEKLLVSD